MIDWLSDPWVWVGVGLVLLLGELLAPGYILLSFSLGAFGMTLGLALWSIGPGLFLPEPSGTGGVLALLLAWMLLSGAAAFVIWRLRPGRADGEEEQDVNDFQNRM
ncbi:MAG: hypothetical protein ACQEUZ_06555 [Pseudomonadota bacterium]